MKKEMVLKNTYVIPEQALFDIVEDNGLWDSFCGDQDGHSTIINLEALEYMEEELAEECLDSKIKMVREWIALIHELATENDIPPSRIEFIVKR
ncbi:MAG: hypothetical protein ACRC6B_05230 [Fusobacteriaceae bacterium]